MVFLRETVDSRKVLKRTVQSQKPPTVLPAITHPVIIFGRDDVFRLLGSCYSNYLHDRFLGSLHDDPIDGDDDDSEDEKDQADAEDEDDDL